MAFSLDLNEPWASRGWKAKIRDRERLEPPHVTIMHGPRAWRFNLRTGAFMDREPPPRDVPVEIVDEIRARLGELRMAWDELYPENRSPEGNPMTDPIFVLGPAATSRALDRLPAHRVHSVAEAETLGRSAIRARWVAARLRADLLPTIGAIRTANQRLLVLEPIDIARRELLATHFDVVVAPGDGVKLLPIEELLEVLASANAVDLFIGGAVDREAKSVVLYRGNLERLVVPVSAIVRTPARARVDLNDFEIIDGGQTVRLGEFEAAADAILYEVDAGARRRQKERAVERDDTFGGSLRRLRLQRGLSRSDFPGVTEKTIARIERGEVERPHGATLNAIAQRLGVTPAEIETY